MQYHALHGRLPPAHDPALAIDSRHAVLTTSAHSNRDIGRLRDGMRDDSHMVTGRVQQDLRHYHVPTGPSLSKFLCGQFAIITSACFSLPTSELLAAILSGLARSIVTASTPHTSKHAASSLPAACMHDDSWTCWAARALNAVQHPTASNCIAFIQSSFRIDCGLVHFDQSSRRIASTAHHPHTSLLLTAVRRHLQGTRKPRGSRLELPVKDGQRSWQYGFMVAPMIDQAHSLLAVAHFHIPAQMGNTQSASD
jgi:hypothetical protein